MPRRLVLLLLAALLVPAASANAASPDIVISQVYGGGGNAGAPYTNDFIQLQNRGGAPVDVGGWSVQYASAAGSSWQVTPLSGSIAPGGSYLVQEAAGSTPSQPLPTPNATGSIAMSATSGKVALVTSTTALSCSTGCVAKDLIGYGTASDFETAPAPTLSNTTAAIRGSGADTDSNAADFTAGAPNPGTGGAAPTSVSSSDPADGAVDVPEGSSIHVTFSQDVTIDPSGFALTCDDAPIAASVTQDDPTHVTVDPDADLPTATACTLRIAASATSPALARTAFVDFSTTGIPGLRIHDIQGAAHRSPHAGEIVAAVPGVVTAVGSNGFWMQDPRPDRSDSTSEGIFVFRGSGVAVNDAVTVSGEVQEFRGGTPPDPNSLSTTELANAGVTHTGTGTIAPTVIGPGGRRPPLKVIEDDASGDVEAPGFLFDPKEDGLDFDESLEGMLVQVDHPEVVGPRNSFGELPIVERDSATPRTPRGGVLIRPDDFNPERIILDDVLFPTPVANTGDRLAGPVRAVVDYSFGNYKFLATAAPQRIDGGLQREVTEAPRSNELAIASMNVENLTPAQPEKAARLAEIVVTNLRAPDILGVEEMQDDNGATNDAVTDASDTFAEFIAAIEAAGGPHYEYRQIDPVDDADGGEPGGNIRVGFLFRTDRGLSFVDRPGGTSTNGTVEDASKPGAQLDAQPRPGRSHESGVDQQPQAARGRVPVARQEGVRDREPLQLQGRGPAARGPLPAARAGVGGAAPPAGDRAARLRAQPAARRSARAGRGDGRLQRLRLLGDAADRPERRPGEPDGHAARARALLVRVRRQLAGARPDPGHPAPAAAVPGVRLGARERGVRRPGVRPRPADRPGGAIAALLVLLALAAPPRIHDIQGRGDVSPRAGDTVAGVAGVVTAVTDGGFYMQDPRPDRDAATSEGVFVARAGARAVGDAVTVAGKVVETRPGNERTNLTITGIDATSVRRTGTGRVKATAVQPPARRVRRGLAYHESLEGMLVRIPRPQVVGPRSSFGELPVVVRGATPRTARGGVLLRPRDVNPERLILDDELAKVPVANVGDRLRGTVRAVVSYSFGNYKYEVTSAPRRVDRHLRRERTAPAGRRLAVASMNVENLSAADPASKFRRLARIVAFNLRAPDIVAVEEMQDDDGAPTEGRAGARRTFRRFTGAIRAAGGPRYRFRQIDPVPGADGGEPGGNIRVGFLFRTDRGLRFEDRGRGDATTPTREDRSRPGAQLTLSPGRVMPRNPAFRDSRKPLAGQFRFRGRRLFVVAVHLNSKGGDQPLMGRFQPPRRASETQRHAQARAVRDFSRSLLRADRRARVVVLGDFNDFDFSRTLAIVRGAGLVNLMSRLPLAQRYSYVFEGNSQVLDQVLVSRALARGAAYDSVHVNAEFADQASDHDPQVALVRP